MNIGELNDDYPVIMQQDPNMAFLVKLPLNNDNTTSDKGKNLGNMFIKQHKEQLFEHKEELKH